MFILENITELVADTLGSADGLVYVPVRVSVYPIVYRAVGDESSQLNSEGSVDTTVLELRRHKLEGRDMMRSYDYP